MERNPANTLMRMKFDNINSYGYLLMIFTIMLMLIYFIQKKVRRFLPNKGKLNSIWRESIKKEC